MPSRRRLGHFAGLAFFLILAGLWFISTYNRPELLNRDWVAFDNAGWRALGGNWAAVYTVSAVERWAYLYPPYVIALSLPLGLVPFWPSYVLDVAMVLAGVWWSCRRFLVTFGFQQGRYLVFCSTLLCAPTTVQVVITGQYSWIYLMSLAGLASYWREGQDKQAGRSLALLAVKPNVGILVLPLLVLRGKWAVLREAARTTAIAIVITLPLTLGGWGAFVDAARGVAQRQETGEAPFDKQITILSFLRVISGRVDGSIGIWLVWLAITAVLSATIALVWRGADEQTPGVRLVGLAALAIVALSPRLYFYDGLVMAVPAAAWYLGRSDYTYRTVRRLQGLSILAIVAVTMVFFPIPAVGTAVGPIAGLWIILEAVDLSAGRRSRRTLSPPPEQADPLVLAS